MASPSKPQLFFISILLLVKILGSYAQNNKPRAFHVPIKKDTETRQYYASFEIGNPQVDFNAVIDLGGGLSSFACDKFKSQTHNFTACETARCKSYTETKVCGADTVYVHSTDGTAELLKRYGVHLFFSCVNSSTLDGLANGTSGILGLGRNRFNPPSLTNSYSSGFKVAKKFSLCLPSSIELGFGDLFIGSGPYMFPGSGDASEWLVYTPLINTSGSEYFINVKSIKLDKRVLRFDSLLLSLDNETGKGGTKISTTTLYTVLHSSIYKALVDEFVKRTSARNITRVAAVEPFGACFSTANLHWTRAGPRVPLIDIELEGNTTSVNWRINGANSMVRVNNNTLCLGFVDGGLDATTSIVLGGYQLEDNFLKFDLVSLKLGFTSTILPRGAACSQLRVL